VAPAAGPAPVPAETAERVRQELYDSLVAGSGEAGAEAVLKLRASPGLRVVKYLGNFSERAEGEADLPFVGAESCVLATLAHDGNALKDGEELFLQAALLYTDALTGARRIRVHNLRLAATESIQVAFRHADIDAVLTTLVRKCEYRGTEAAAEVTNGSGGTSFIYIRHSMFYLRVALSPPLAAVVTARSKDARFVHADLTEAAIDMLGSYRRHCAPNSSPGQLILPESLKLLPLYLSALAKLGAFAANRSGGGGGAGDRTSSSSSGGRLSARGGAATFADLVVRADARAAELHLLNGLPPSRLVPLVYPRLFVLHNLGGLQGLPLDSDDDVDEALAAAGATPAHHQQQQQRGSRSGGGGARPPVHPSALSYAELLRVVLPPTTYPSAEQLASHGVYLLESSAGLFLYVGLEADEDVVRGLFGPLGISSAGQLPREAVLPPPPPPEALPSIAGTPAELSLRVWTIIAALRARRPPYLPLSVVASADVEARDRFGSLLAEDRVGAARSYVDLLCYVHTAIQGRMTKE
jgi:protein transport protein SEC24